MSSDSRNLFSSNELLVSMAVLILFAFSLDDKVDFFSNRAISIPALSLSVVSLLGFTIPKLIESPMPF